METINEQLRKTFEAAEREIDHGCGGLDLTLNPDGSYADSDIESDFYWFKKGVAASQAPQEPENNSAFIAAIEYSLKHQDLEFLHAWFHGNFKAIRREWDDVPDSVFIGADPLYAPAPEGDG